MPFALYSRSPSCFYCGARSHEPAKVRRFKCQHCEAVNYLDENGQITEPPPQTTPRPAKPVQFGYIAARSSSSPPPNLEDLFCRTCLQNQHLVTENLSNYLPPDDDPQYERYLKGYNFYRESQEQRYPQVCSQCAPRVRERIKESAKVAQQDHLQRMIARTKHSGVGYRRGNVFVKLVIGIGGFGWGLSAIGQACWHVLSALAVPREGVSDRPDGAIKPGSSVEAQVGVCMRQVLLQSSVGPACVTIFSQAMPLVLLVGLTTLWWNKQLWSRYFGSGGRMVKMVEYYTIQAFLITLRLTAWNILHPVKVKFTGEMLKGAHLFMGLLILMAYPTSLFTVKLKTGARLAFHLSDDSILPHMPFNPKKTTNSNLLQSNDTPEPFPIHRLASSAAPSFVQLSPEQSVPVSSEHDPNDPDMMDWTPSAKRPIISFNPNPRAPVLSLSSSTASSSPFRGTLPPAPKAPAHKLRSLPQPAAGSFRKATDVQKNNFSQSLSTGAYTSTRVRSDHTTSQRDAYESDSTAADTEDEAGRGTTRAKRRNDFQMAAPRFWPTEDIDRKTGLEDIFEEAFTIRDTPLKDERGKIATHAKVRVKWGGFGDFASEDSLNEVDASGNDLIAPSASGSWVLVGIVPVVILGIATVVVKGGLI